MLLLLLLLLLRLLWLLLRLRRVEYFRRLMLLLLLFGRYNVDVVGVGSASPLLLILVSTFVAARQAASWHDATSRAVQVFGYYVRFAEKIFVYGVISRLSLSILKNVALGPLVPSIIHNLHDDSVSLVRFSRVIPLRSSRSRRPFLGQLETSGSSDPGLMRIG